MTNGNLNYTLYIQWRKIVLLLDLFWISISLILGLFGPKQTYFIRFEAHNARNITFVNVVLALLNQGSKLKSIGKMRV